MKRYIVLGALLVLCGCGQSGPYTLTTQEESNTENGARQYAENVGGKYVSCSGQDTDNIGYVTCGYKDLTTNQVTEIRCSYRNGVKGCKKK